MADFTLDTSGAVRLLAKDAPWKGLPKPDIYWADLDAFTQGYVEALFASLHEGDRFVVPFASGSRFETISLAFSDLSPEALAMILADCAGFNLKIGDASHNRGIGAQFWKARQAGFNAHWSLHQTEFVAAFPPLTVSLGDDGKVHLAVRS